MLNHSQKHGRRFLLLIPIIFILIASCQIQATVGARNKNIPQKNIPILCYHRVIPNPTSVYDLTPDQLEAHFQFFHTNGYTPITVAEFLKFREQPALFPEKPIILTFDDGSKSHFTHVLPLLKKYGYKATFYIFTNAMRGSKERWLSWDEVRKIAQAGMDIGSHTVSHPYLTSRDKMNEAQYKAWLEKELAQSKKILEEKLTVSVTSLAYPFGLYDREVEAAAIKAGYSGMLTLNMGLNRPDDNPWRLKRRLMVNSVGPKSLTSILSEKVLKLEILSPVDTNIETVKPVIRFRIKTPSIDAVRLEISKYQAVLKPDSQGIYSYEIPGKLRTGFQTIIIRGTDANQKNLVNSWSFYYRPLANQQ